MRFLQNAQKECTELGDSRSLYYTLLKMRADLSDNKKFLEEFSTPTFCKALEPIL
jgi:hypothetical protein